jgi:hypothetical protein
VQLLPLAVDMLQERKAQNSARRVLVLQRGYDGE